jgi:hypothetical protein
MRRAVCISVGFLAILALCVPAMADNIYYTQDFATTGTQATTSGYGFADYAGWSYWAYSGFGIDQPLAGDGTGSAKVNTAGTLTLKRETGSTLLNRLSGIVSAYTVSGGTQPTSLDLSTEAVTVSGTISGHTASPGDLNVGLRVGDMLFRLTPGYAPAQAAVTSVKWGSDLLPAPTLGYTLAVDTPYTISATIVQSGTNYNVNYSMGSYVSPTLTLAVDDVGANSWTNFGIVATTYWNNDYVTLSNFSVTQGTVPEPSTLVLLTCGFIGLLAYAWRKRK